MLPVPWRVWPQSVIWALLHIYLWWRLVHGPTSAGSTARRVGTACVLVLALMIPAALVAMYALEPSVAAWIAWPGFIWYALMVFLVTVLFLAEPVRLGVMLAQRKRAKAREQEERPASLDRRTFLARSTAATAGVVATGLTGFGLVTAVGPPEINRVIVRLRGGGPGLAGFRIALVSDMHLGALLGRSHAERLVSMVNSTRPDLIAVVGDLVDGTVGALRDAASPLSGLRSRHGAYFVTGNHEYLSGADAWLDELRDLGMHPLENARVEMPAFDLAGVNDVTGKDSGDPPDYEKALGDRDPSRPVILLAHQPVQVNEFVKYGGDLQLSGHTHGGQFPPLSLLSAAFNPTLAGYERYGATQLYVTKGTGFWGPPVRIDAPPDITVVELAAE